MSFSCTIKVNDKPVTEFNEGPIHYGLLGLAPNTAEATEAPWRLDEIRAVVSRCRYGDRFKEAAQDCIREIQSMLKENRDSLRVCHCPTCTCGSVKPEGWSVEKINEFLAINPESVTHVSGGY